MQLLELKLIFFFKIFSLILDKIFDKSPCIVRSTFTLLLNDDASISKCIFFDLGENPVSYTHPPSPRD